MDENTLKNKLIRFGMTEPDATALIKFARHNEISIRKALTIHFIGAYKCMAAYLFVYVFFVYDMTPEDAVLFTLIYGCIFTITYLFTPFLKGVLWSLIVIYKLRGD